MTSLDERFGRRFGLGDIDQISFAVPSVDDALPRYEVMFGGTFTAMDVPDFDVVCRGEPSSTTLRLGFGRTGALEVELVEVVTGAWPTVDWLAEHGEGLHHLRYPVADLAASRASMESGSCTTILEGGTGGVSFAYLEVPMLNGMVVELIQMPG